MRLSKSFFTYNIGSETVLVPVAETGFSGMVRGNGTFGAILELMAEDTTEADIVAAMRSRFEAPEGEIERDVRRAIDELSGIGALED